MQKYFLIFLILLIMMIIGCSNSSSNTKVSYNNLSINEVLELLNTNSNIIIVDVRTSDEIKESGIIPNAINVDFKSSDFKEQLSKLDKSKEYLLYCRTGNRSGQAAQVMSEEGFSNINNLNNAGYDEFSKALAQ